MTAKSTSLLKAKQAKLAGSWCASSTMGGISLGYAILSTTHGNASAFSRQNPEEDL